MASSGTVVSATGPVNVERGGKQVGAPAGFVVQSGDTISTGEQGKAQLRFEDDSIFAIPAGSALRIDDLQVRRTDTGTPGKAIFSLIKGGFRTITGLVGKVKGDIYEVRTPMATIGVRGSAYAAVLCSGACTSNGKYPEGLYVKAEKGIITLKNGQGTLSLRPGQVGFAANAGVGPIRVDHSPFDNPEFASSFDLQIEIDVDINPPRIEPEPPASPSRPGQ